MGPPLVTCLALSLRVRSGLVAARDREPLGAVEAAAAGSPTSPTAPASRDATRRPAPRVVVLETAAQHVRVVIVGRHHVELPDRQIVQEAPALGTVLGDVHAAVVPLNHAVGVLRVDPERMMVHM